MKEFEINPNLKHEALAEAEKAYKLLKNRKYKMFPNGRIWDDLLERVYKRTKTFAPTIKPRLRRTEEYSFISPEGKESIDTHVRNPLNNVGFIWGIHQQKGDKILATVVILEIGERGNPKIELRELAQEMDENGLPKGKGTIMTAEIRKKPRVEVSTIKDGWPTEVVVVTAQEAVSKFNIPGSL